MCCYVVAALPGHADKESISEVFDKYGKKLAIAEQK
jgi:hypothetical protein